MLDYAANAAMYWKVAALQERFEHRCGELSVDPDEELGILLGEDIDIEGFWSKVKPNLEAKKLRLLFVADAIPPELRVIVDFLNSQMYPTEILALELRQYEGENGLRTIVPALYGMTEQSRGLRTGRSATHDEPASRSYWEMKHPATMQVADKLIHLALKCGNGIQPKYNRPYIGMTVHGAVSNFITLRPKRGWVELRMHATPSEEMDAEMERSGVQLIQNNIAQVWKSYRLRVTEADMPIHNDLLSAWIRRAFIEWQDKQS